MRYKTTLNPTGLLLNENKHFSFVFGLRWREEMMTEFTFLDKLPL